MKFLLSRIEVVPKTPGDARKACSYRKRPLLNVNFMKECLEVDGMRENRLFFDSCKGQKMAAPFHV
jgi:hypothetical protein